MVRFGGTTPFITFLVKSCFNSSMVRFGVNLICIRVPGSLWFQFQYGAIWSVSAHSKNSLATEVSIPVWCDLERHAVICVFSFLEVSIPVWCDLEYLSEQNRMASLMFQFQYGAIWSFGF